MSNLKPIQVSAKVQLIPKRNKLFIPKPKKPAFDADWKYTNQLVNYIPPHFHKITLTVSPNQRKSWLNNQADSNGVDTNDWNNDIDRHAQDNSFEHRILKFLFKNCQGRFYVKHLANLQVSLAFENTNDAMLISMSF